MVEAVYVTNWSLTNLRQAMKGKELRTSGLDLDLESYLKPTHVFPTPEAPSMTTLASNFLPISTILCRLKD